MRKTFLTLGLLVVVILTGCRPAGIAVPNTSVPATPSTSPLPTSSVPPVEPGASLSPVSTPVAASGIHLTATIGPSCPGPERPGQVCTQPYEGLFVVTDNVNDEVARVTTDQNGQATLDLPPGAYTIAPQVEGKWPSGAPVNVTVVAGQYVEVSIELDSGIR